MVTSKYICRKTVTDSGSGPFEVTDLNVGHLSDEEVTEGDPGESHAVRDVPAFPHPVQHLETEHVVLHGEEGVEKEELGHDVDAVEQLDEQVKPHEEGPVTLGQPEAEDTCHTQQ